jgi:23S rRNA (cytosine1962-C5)-methyltransferase
MLKGKLTAMNTVTLSARGTERQKSGHPWIYRSDVTSTPEKPGLYAVKSAAGKHLGWAAVNKKSEITVRMLTRFEQVADEALLLKRLSSAIDARAEMGIDADSYRVVHSDADGLPGLTIDKYADVLVVQNNSAALEPFLDALLEVLIERFKPVGVLARFDSKTRLLEGLEQNVFEAFGSVPESIIAREGSVQFLVDPWRGQKTGAFLDQRDNRIALERHAKGKALDVFSYHASFGLHLAKVCESVECVDSSAAALERGAENAKLNNLENMKFTTANAFEFLREREQAGAKYQTISLDPPALAKARRDLDSAYRAYKEINLRALKLLEPGGILGTASCSFHVSESDFYVMLTDAAKDSGRNVRVLERRGQSADHPELLLLPESRYLKYVILEVVE